MQKHNEGMWISVLLRLAIASLFVAAAVGKYVGGLDGVVKFFQETFKNSWLPAPLVTLHAYLTPIIETVIPIWLILGIRLKAAWMFAALFMVSLAFGMAVAGNYSAAANNYTYVLICLAGLYFSQFDRLNLEAVLEKEK